MVRCGKLIEQSPRDPRLDLVLDRDMRAKAVRVLRQQRSVETVGKPLAKIV